MKAMQELLDAREKRDERLAALQRQAGFLLLCLLVLLLALWLNRLVPDSGLLQSLQGAAAIGSFFLFFFTCEHFSEWKSSKEMVERHIDALKWAIAIEEGR